MHLTNYSINKFSEKYNFNQDIGKDDKGHKRSLLWFWDYLSEMNLDEAML